MNAEERRAREALGRSDPYGSLMLAVVELARRDASKGRLVARRWLEDIRAQLAERSPDAGPGK